MDIAMILNPTDTHSENSKAPNHTEIREDASDAQSKLPTFLADYQNQLATIEKECWDRLESMKHQLPSIPLRRRNLNYNHHHRYFHRSRSFPKAKSTRPHSNKIYTLEEVDFIRYHKADLGLKWEFVLTQFQKAFPTHSRETQAALSSRYYRDNRLPQYNENSTVMRDGNGNILYLSAKVRERKTPEGKEEGLPYGLVQRYPQRGSKYTWVGEEHKEQMRKLALEMDDDTRECMYSLNTQQLRKDRETTKTADGRVRSSASL